MKTLGVIRGSPLELSLDYAECLGTAQHAATPEDAFRNGNKIQLRQPAMPERRVRGVVGVRVFSAVRRRSVPTLVVSLLSPEFGYVLAPR